MHRHFWRALSVLLLLTFSRLPASAATWSGWSVVPGGGTTDTAPCATVFNNQLFLFIKGLDQQIYYKAADLNGAGWSGWWKVPGGGTTNAAPSCGGTASYLRLYVKGGVDQRIYEKVMSTSGGWLSWYEVPGGGTTDAPIGVAAHPSFYGIDIFVKGIGDRRVYVNELVGGWSGWYPTVPNATTDRAIAAAWGFEEQYLFVKGIEDNQVYRFRLQHPGSGWALLPGLLTDQAPAAAGSASSLFLFARQKITQRIFFRTTVKAPSGVWSELWDPWTEVPGGGLTDHSPAAVLAPNGKLFVFVRGLDGQVWINTRTGT